MRRDQLLERHVVEAEVVGVDDDLARGVDAAGDDDADALKLRLLDARAYRGNNKEKKKERRFPCIKSA